jgi:hypothetical protein
MYSLCIFRIILKNILKHGSLEILQFVIPRDKYTASHLMYLWFPYHCVVGFLGVGGGVSFVSFFIAVGSLEFFRIFRSSVK